MLTSLDMGVVFFVLIHECTYVVVLFSDILLSSVIGSITVVSPENAISSRAFWRPIFQTSKNSNFKVSKKYLDVANCIHHDIKFSIRNTLLRRLRIKDKLDKF
jgi:hypothetical protein